MFSKRGLKNFFYNKQIAIFLENVCVCVFFLISGNSLQFVFIEYILR